MRDEAIHLKIGAKRDNRYWLHVAVRPRTTLESLDDFLRGIWLECCGHLSAFSTSGRNGAELSFRSTVGEVFVTFRSVDYVYDFGSSTELVIKRVKATASTGGGIVLLGRNDPPVQLCECGRPASAVCMDCSIDDGGLYCDEHAELHECGEDRLLPVVNSPRSGVCGYDGG